ncbi:Sec7 domain protein [Ancylostoma duodenale]|uniref:Sec7 domain protein n=1 Tax=Ancylostoma duodenale TaxID=51022 RepID=A0A0C2FMM7_9BILA|nr:Sec7 domain protein [Ancylostoma duodenale]
MAAVAQSGAREALSTYPSSPVASPCDSSSLARGDSPSATRSPRCEAFVMTGDKILNLNHHISPNYAKVARDQLPPSTQILETPKPRPPPTLSDFPSVRRSMRSRIPTSRSQPEAVSTQRQVSCPEPVPERCSPADLSSGSPSIALPPPSIDEKPPPTATVSSPVTSEKSQEADLRTASDFASIDEDPPSSATTAQVMESSMHSSYYKSAFSNPQISHKKTGSSDTFVISTADSPTKHSTVTVNAINCAPSVSTTTSPSQRRLMSTRRQHTGNTEVFGSFRSDGTIGADSQCPLEEEREAAREAAKLFRLEGCTKADVAERLNDRSEFSALVTTKYLELFVFSSLRIDAALREFLSRVELRGDSSERERLLRFFSTRYHQCDPSLFDSVDDVHTLTCALLLLNSDLHGQNLGKKMTIRDFINNISHTGVHYKRDLLKALYNSIKENEIVHASKFEKPLTTKVASKRSFVSRQLLLEVDPDSQVEYKCGYIMRKCVYDADGAKTPFGRRGWREWYARLRGLVLYLGRDDSDKKRSRYETFNNAILLHHAFAEPAPDYKKKQYIFRVRTANLGEFLFQTTSANEVEDWVTQINFACARFSSRALPPPACSGGAFSRARLPKLPSSAPLAQQLKAHESAACELREQLNRVRQEAPPLKAKGRPVEEFFFKERYLTQEILRYDTYCHLLRSRLPGGGCELGGAPSDSTSGVHSKSDIADDLDKMSYREA